MYGRRELGGTSDHVAAHRKPDTEQQHGAREEDQRRAAGVNEREGRNALATAVHIVETTGGVFVPTFTAIELVALLV
jgi:hypothetical protein